MEGQYVRGGYMPRVRGRGTTTLEDRESRSRQTDTASPPGCIPFPIPSPYPSPDIPIAVPICLLCRALGFTLPSLSFSFSLLASPRFALLCSPALFALASSGFIVGYSPDSRSFVQTVLYLQQGGLGRAQLRVNCSLYTQLCVSV